ncbi:hypothetical protein AK812_SmicGene21553 [Symbiodinium microadriaticum]|uniref:Uncharacterized protein n=1 Tax=Symbiodinium microadriaticum TaxID=2951 RepID=A0A1Q9DM09_SYMMI|nr:hypothetical protein AK812_SmicGene21553 [Symbiodinium microadriaticum]
MKRIRAWRATCVWLMADPSEELKPQSAMSGSALPSTLQKFADKPSSLERILNAMSTAGQVDSQSHGASLLQVFGETWYGKLSSYVVLALGFAREGSAGLQLMVMLQTGANFFDAKAQGSRFDFKLLRCPRPSGDMDRKRPTKQSQATNHKTMSSLPEGFRSTASLAHIHVKVELAGCLRIQELTADAIAGGSFVPFPLTSNFPTDLHTAEDMASIQDPEAGNVAGLGILLQKLVHVHIKKEEQEGEEKTEEDETKQEGKEEESEGPDQMELRLSR